MKRLFSISFIALSNLILLILVVVPHHHHEGLACIVMEICEQDNQVNDEHTGHQELPDDSEHDQSCIAESKYIAPNETKCKVFSCPNYGFTHLFPALFLAADLLIYDRGISTSCCKYGAYILFHTSAEANPFHGLRAPPTATS
ncbi:MAG: hypothetical protein LBH58_12345 [Tannerellaceae bacterium]|nr:hypothetical protein [Tannerellaceae bacterium]